MFQRELEALGRAHYQATRLFCLVYCPSPLPGLPGNGQHSDPQLPPGLKEFLPLFIQVLVTHPMPGTHLVVVTMKVSFGAHCLPVMVWPWQPGLGIWSPQTPHRNPTRHGGAFILPPCTLPSVLKDVKHLPLSGSVVIDSGV